LKLDQYRSKEATNAKKSCDHRSPPRLFLRRQVDLNLLWGQLTDAQRHQALATLSHIVARQLAAPLVEEEVSHERA